MGHWVSNSRDDDFSTVYVTIAEAADRIGEPAERIRQAVLDQKVDAIKENPQNKRSRWLVRLDDVDELLRSDYGPIVAADATTVALTPNGSDIMTTNRPSYPDPQDQAPAGAGNEVRPEKNASFLNFH